MVKKIKGLEILSGITAVLLVLYIVSMFFSEAVMFLLSPFGAIVIFGYGCLVVGLVRQKSWAWGILVTIILSAILIVAIITLILGLQNISDLFKWLYSMFFFASLFILPVFGISAVIRRIIKRYRQRKK